MALLKIVSSKTNLEKSKKLCKKYKLTIIDKTSKSLVLEISALKKEIDQLIKKLQPIDQFPHTLHVENVILLTQ